MGNKRVASAEGAPAVPHKRMKRAKNPRDAIHKAIDNFTTFPEQPDWEDHQAEQALYKALSHRTRELQVKAAVLVSKALIGQSGNEEPVEPTISEEDLKKHLEMYLFPALTKGHAVSREGTFRVLSKVFAGLVGDRVLAASKYPGLTFNQLLEMLVRHTALDDASSEENPALGRLLGIRCFVQPDILSKDAQRWKELLPLLLELATKNSELQLACCSIIADAVEDLNQTDASFTINAVSESSVAKTPEGLAIWVAALRQHPDLKSKTWKKPVSAKSSANLMVVLKESATKVLNENGPGTDNGKPTWTSPLHFVWGKLAAYFGKLGDDALKDFCSLWTPVVEDYLFAKNATDLQKARGFLVFQQMLKGVAEHKALVMALFSRNFLVCLQNHASRKDRHLHAVAVETLASIENVATAKPKSIVPIMEGLLGPNGNYDFEPRTRTKAIEKILKHTREEDVKVVLTLLESPFKKSSGGKERLSAFGNAYILYLYYLASNGAAAALEKLCSLAFSGPDVRSKYGLSDSSKATCKTHLESAFAKSSRSTGDYDGISRAVASMKPDSVVELNEDVAAQQKVALKSLKGLLKNKGVSTEDNLTQAIALLHAVALFQVYSLAPGAETLLTGVNTFYESFKSGADQETWQLLIVKVLLPMVHRPSSLGRLVSKHVFECFAPKLDLEAMQVLVERLEFTEDLAGYNDLLGDLNAGDESEDEEEDGTNSEVASSEEGEDSESDEDSDGSMDMDQGQLLKSLGSHLLDGEAQKPTTNGKKAEKKEDGKEKKKGNEDEGGDEEGSDSGSDADMTDSEMMAINDTLVAAFDHITSNGPESNEAKEAKTFVLNFKNRIIDLVEAYLQHQSGNAAIIFPILPDLVRLAARTTSSDLRVRTIELLARYRKRFVKDRKRWLEEGSGKNIKENLGVLEQIHEEMGSRDSQKFAKGASSACLTVAAAVVAMDRDKIGELNRIHDKFEGEMKKKRRKVHKSFFETWKAYQQSVCNGTEQA